MTKKSPSDSVLYHSGTRERDIIRDVWLGSVPSTQNPCLDRIVDSNLIVWVVI